MTITDGSKGVRWLNEIEYINGEVWGMIWQTECIARVDPKDGSVIGWLLMDGCDGLSVYLSICLYFSVFLVAARPVSPMVFLSCSAASQCA